MITILEAMIEEHKRVNEVFDIFRVKCNFLGDGSAKKDYRNLLPEFLKFRWTLEKHFFVEEKAVFSAYLRETNQETNDDVNHLLKDHQEMIDILTEIEEDVRAGIKPTISEIIEAIDAHEKTEEDSFYPKLDEVLNLDQKEAIIERSKEIILG